MYLRAKRRRWRGAGVGVERGEREGVEGRGKEVHGRCGAVPALRAMALSPLAPASPHAAGKATERGGRTCRPAR